MQLKLFSEPVINLKEDLFKAYYDTRRSKRNTLSALKFELDFESSLLKLNDELEQRVYEIGPSFCFIVKEPKPREVFAAGFRDRVVHHLLYNYINPLLDKEFINDSYSCRLKRGTSYGIRRASYVMATCSSNYTKFAYILKLDIRNYFGSIDRPLLLSILRNTLQPKWKNNKVAWEFIDYLLVKMLTYDPVKECRIKGKRSEWALLPAEKSLFNTPVNKGLPIGNLTSQLFANVYLHELDRFVKNELKIKYYGRYVDDFYLIHESKQELKNCVDKIRSFLLERLMLQLHEKKIYLQTLEKGCLFLGAYLKPGRTYIGNRTKGNFYRNLKLWNRILEQSENGLTKAMIADFVCMVNSYLGYFAQFNTFKIRKKMISSYMHEDWRRYVKPVNGYKKLILLPADSAKNN